MKKLVSLFVLIGIFIAVWYFFPVQDRGIGSQSDLIVGTNAEYPPFAFVEGDVVRGFDIDLIHVIGKRLNKKIKIKDMPFDVLIPEVQRGSIQVVAAGMTPSVEREKEVRFSDCYFTGDPLVIVSLSSRPLKTVDELDGKRVVVNEGYTADYYMSDVKGPELVRLPAPAAAFLALNSGRVDAYVSARSTVKSFFDQYDTKNFIITVIPGTEERYALAVSPRFSQYLPQLNKLIDEIKKDGTLDRLKSKWGL